MLKYILQSNARINIRGIEREGKLNVVSVSGGNSNVKRSNDGT